MNLITSMLRVSIFSKSRIAVSMLMATLIWSPGAYTANQASISEIYRPYAELLDKYLIEHTPGNTSGLVTAFDYQSALDDNKTRQLIRRQKNNLKTFDTKSLNSKDRALSFWINAYNFFMLAHILDNAKKDGVLVESVKDYGSFINPYRVFGQEMFNVGGKQYSLDTIEKEILLGETYKKRGWKDARVHFAVNCASVGCPPLRNVIYTPDNIDALLTENTRLALQTPRHLRVDGDTLYLTQLFDWYKSDFIEAAGSIRDFINKYTPDSRYKRIKSTGSISYIDYDWALNKPGNFSEISRTSSREHDGNRS